MNWFHYNWLYCKFDILAPHREVHTLIMIGSNSIQSQTTMLQGVVTELMIAIYLPSQGIKLPPGSWEGRLGPCQVWRIVLKAWQWRHHQHTVNKDVNWSGSSGLSWAWWLATYTNILDLLPSQSPPLPSSWRHKLLSSTAQGQTELWLTVMTGIKLGLKVKLGGFVASSRPGPATETLRHRHAIIWSGVRILPW